MDLNFGAGMKVSGFFQSPFPRFRNHSHCLQKTRTNNQEASRNFWFGMDFPTDTLPRSLELSVAQVTCLSLPGEGTSDIPDSGNTRSVPVPESKVWGHQGTRDCAAGLSLVLVGPITGSVTRVPRRVLPPSEQCWQCHLCPVLPS